MPWKYLSNDFICLHLGYIHEQNRKRSNIIHWIIIRYVLSSEEQSWNFTMYENFILARHWHKHSLITDHWLEFVDILVQQYY